MLLIYLTVFQQPQQLFLQHACDSVQYWPRSWANIALDPIVTDWWINFSDPCLGYRWILQWPDYTRVVQEV